MITTFAVLFAAAYLYPERTAATLATILSNFGTIMLIAAAIDAATLLTVARWRGWVR